MTLLILAFDGPLLETLELRAASILDALREFAVDVVPSDVRALLPGRTLDEVIERCAPQSDDTMRDLMHLHATRLVSRRMAMGVASAPHAIDSVKALHATGTQLVVRADSTRADAEHLLGMAGLESVVRFLHCADDVPFRNDASALERSYAAIMTRLPRLGTVDQCSALECDERAAVVARRFVPRATAFAGWR